MVIRYTIADPTGNITSLVESPIAYDLRQKVSAALMAAEADVEQLGFLSPAKNGADIALTMSGGEFCGNACLSAAAYHLRRTQAESGLVRVAISGAEVPVAVQLEKKDENEYAGFVDMPLPLGIEPISTPFGQMPIVRFPGISHVIVPSSLSHPEAEAMIAPLCATLGAEALGFMLLDEEAATLRPLVYVPGADSLFWERSCASGTSAVGAWLAKREQRDISLCLTQPGGSLTISAFYADGGVRRLSLGGSVRLLPEKSIEL